MCLQVKIVYKYSISIFMGKLRNLIIFFTSLLLISVAGYFGYLLAYKNLVLPRVTIAGIEVTGMNKQNAQNIISAYLSKYPSVIVLRNNGKESLGLENFKVGYDINWAADQALLTGRSGNILTQLNEQFRILTNGKEIQIPIKYDTDELEGILDEVETQMNTSPVYPKLVLKDNTIELVKGANGLIVRRDELKKEILKQLGIPGKKIIDIPMEVALAQESDEQSRKAVEAANKWIGKKLTLKGKYINVELTSDKIIQLYGLVSDPVNLKYFEELTSEIAPKIETEPRDAVFTFEENKVKEFKPEVVGSKIDLPAFKDKIVEVLYKVDVDSIDIPLILNYPKITTGQINNLGIKELIGSGKSAFAHSIPGRVFNVNLAASRINGAIVPPGEEFSFNKFVGEISRETGYQSAYIISGGKTVLGDGGGVCQVSTTVFRAALNAGLPITERKAHAYRVGYYEQDSGPGIDATVYSPSVDLKFKNDTGNHILVQTHVDTKKLTMTVDIYGTSDGRKSAVSDPKISSQTPPPATLYVEDPTLPLGTQKQIDWSAWGAKVSFNYKVERGGETLIEKTFYSNYQPWQAIYLKGTKTN